MSALSLVPAASSGLVVTSGNGQVALNWDPSDGATSYTVWRVATVSTQYTQLATQAGTLYLDTSVVNGTTYRYAITASTISGSSATPLPIGQAVPAGFSATPGDARVSLAWSSSAGATRYNLKRSNTDGGPYTQVFSITSSTRYVDKGLTHGSVVYYVISAQNDNGEGENSAQIAVTPRLSVTGCSILAPVNQRYVTADGNSPLIASATTVGINEQFTLVGVSGSQVALQSVVNETIRFCHPSGRPVDRRSFLHRQFGAVYSSFAG